MGVVVLAAACGRADAAPDLVTETLADGVVRVSSPPQGTWTAGAGWRAVEDLRIGSADGDGSDQLAGPGVVEADALGRIFVLDMITKEVRVFENDGRHVRNFGREGAGPGEFREPIGMAWGVDGELWIADSGNARFSVFDTTGTFLRSYVRNSSYHMVPWPGVIDTAGRLYDIGIQHRREESRRVLLRYDVSLERADTFPLPYRREAQFETVRGSVKTTAAIPFVPRVHWALSGNGVLWSGASENYRLELQEVGGRRLRVGERPYTPVKVEGAERDSLPEQLAWFTRQGGKIDLAAVPESKPAFVSIRLDDRGFAWVRPSTPLSQRNTVFDVFDPEARYLGRVELPGEVPDNFPLVIRGNHIYAAVENDMGVPQVVRYRLEGRTD